MSPCDCAKNDCRAIHTAAHRAEIDYAAIGLDRFDGQSGLRRNPFSAYRVVYG